MELNRRNFLINVAKISAVIYLAPTSLFSTSKEKTTADIFSDIISRASKQRWFDMEMSDLVARVANELINTPYVGGTLDRNADEEQVVVDLTALDCVTFVENSLCIARCIKKQHFRYMDLLDEVSFTRYRGGALTDYTSRLHYTSEWILDNIRKNVVEDVTEKLDGEEHYFNLNFMSQNSDKYPALKKHKEYIDKIKEIEEEVSKQKFFVIKKNNINKIISKIKDGDIIAVATNMSGLDYSHLGLAFDKKMMHASSKHKKVFIDKKISEYVKANRQAIGITVLRPKSIM